MEKTTKKRKSKKGLRKRIGIIAVGGLSLVLTVCLSVGATLAWFAGSTWASKSLYMGGPVYVEMAGRGAAGATGGDGIATAKWKGGEGELDINAAASRTTGTAALSTAVTDTGVALDDILLPGQKVQIYSQARVFSTAQSSTVTDTPITDSSSGANTVNVGGGEATYYNESGRVTTTTTSVLRARFSIEVQFDPGMGYNNFTDADYLAGYPVQSQSGFEDALGATWTPAANDEGEDQGRRDAVATGTWVEAEDAGLRDGSKKSIYQWKYVSKAEHEAAEDDTSGAKGIAMAAPFNGTGTDSEVPYYGVWITDGTTNKVEADAFYKARCNAYLKTYKEYYVNEYGNTVTRTLGDAVTALEDKLNEYFVKLVNDSSDAIHSGMVNGFTVTADGQMTRTAGDAVNASWLYIDPSIGNDTNTDEISTSVGGWWYLVEDDGVEVGSTGDGKNAITTAVDLYSTEDAEGADADAVNEVTETEKALTRADGKTDSNRLDAKLYEIIPDKGLTGENATVNGENVLKTVSDAFPFVNGSFALPSDALTNVFANAKITFKIAFQAIQAFFPYTETIDKVSYTSALLGTEKALSIRNAIPIYNEAFDYQETNGGEISGL